ncbi:type II toxin-antitoxin system RelE/ParE family toxin [Spirochaetota bacterium]
MAHKIIWSPKAATNLESIYDYISQNSENYASIFVDRIMVTIDNIPQFPLSGRKVPEYNDDKIREKILGNYRIVYRIKQKDIIEIVAICHGARILDPITDQ